MSELAMKITMKSMEVVDFLQSVIEAGEEALKLTPELLPVLKKAGVVDAGGRGLLIIFQGFQHLLAGKEDANIAFDDSIQVNNQYDEQAHFDYNDLAEIGRAHV